MLSEGPVDVLVVDLELSSLSRHGIISFLYMKRALRRVLSFWFFITLNSKIVYFQETITADENGILTTSIRAFGNVHYNIIGMRPIDRRGWYYRLLVSNGIDFWQVKILSDSGAVGSGNYTIGFFAIPSTFETT